MRIILFALGILIIISCKQNTEKKAGLNTKELTEIKPESNLDTLNANNYNVLFFHPKEKEFEELLKEYGNENEGLYEVDSDFGFYTNKVIDSLSKKESKIKIVTERIIKYSTVKGIKYLDRLKNPEHPYGIIFNNINCDPQIQFGVMSDLEIFQAFSEYNKNCMSH